MKAKTIQQTCFACPSSWEGELDDGRSWRIRYRWGVMMLLVGADVSVFGSTEVCEEFDYGGPNSGTCTLEEVKEVVGHLIDLDSAKWI